uniref:Uncharacterized protein n=1 Tax=Glossina brevipalpis TaxID=37001 RepID=A0A1A9W240_9MUSC
MGPKRRVSVAERQHRAHATPNLAAKKRPATAISNQSSVTRKSSPSVADPSTSSRKASSKQLTSPVKKSLKSTSKERKSESEKKSEFEKLKEGNNEKVKNEEKKTTRASSRDNVKRLASNSQESVSDKKAQKKEDSPSSDVSYSSHASNSSLSNGSECVTKPETRLYDKKDEKTKAISKMLKSLDIKISGFDNILPKNESITELGLKSSISENVKTKSRAAAVKVIASMNPPKPVKRTKSDEEKKRAQKQSEKYSQQQKEKEFQEKTHNKRTGEKNYVDVKQKEEESNVPIVETKKKLAAKKAKLENIHKPKKMQATLKGSKKDTISSCSSSSSNGKEVALEKKDDNQNGEQKVIIEKINILTDKQNKKSSSEVELEEFHRHISDHLKDENSETDTDTKKLKSPKLKTMSKGESIRDEGKSSEYSKDASVSKYEEQIHKEEKSIGFLNRSPKTEGALQAHKRILSPKIIKIEDKSNLMTEEKEEILSVILDANTEVVQMEIEEITITGLVKAESKQSELAQRELKNNDLLKMDNKVKVKATEAKVKETLKSLFVSPKEKKVSDINHRLQTKFKVTPIKPKISKPIKKTNPASRLLTMSAKMEQKKMENRDDIYDFKSGSEDEEFIKMELPTLKDLREFSDEDNQPLKTTPKREIPKFSGFREKFKKESQLKAMNAPVKHHQEQELEIGQGQDIEKIRNKETEAIAQSPGGLNDKDVVKRSPTKSKKMIKTKSQSNKTTKKPPLKQKEKVTKAVKNKITKKEEKNKDKNNSGDSEAFSSPESSSDSEDEQKLIVFGQKKQRMASLNALAKVQCLYENESRTAYELGLSKATLMPPKIRTLDGSEDERDKEKDKNKEKDTEKDKSKGKERDKLEKDNAKHKEKDTPKSIDDKSKTKKEKKNEDPLKIADAVKEDTEEEPVEEPKRELRYVSGGRGLGKHWEFDSDSEHDEIERMKLKKKKLQKRLQAKKERELEKERIKERKEEESKAKNENIVEQNKDKEPMKVKRKYTKIKKSYKKAAKFATASSEDESIIETSDKDVASEKDDEKEKEKSKMSKNKLEVKNPPKKRKRILKEDLIGDYKGILARKRMASLNASAIVAATYEVERHLDKNLGSECSSYESYEDEKKNTSKKSKETLKNTEKEIKKTFANCTITEADGKLALTTISNTPKTPTKIEKSLNICEESNDSKYSKETKETNTDATTTTSTNTGSCNTSIGTSKDSKESSRPTSSSVVIVQDTDVTITGVYVNSAVGSGQEAYCKMQYRVQSSVTEERLLRPGSEDPPPKSYTPLSALSSMLPPGAAAGVSSVTNESHVTATPPPPSGNTSQPSVGNSVAEAINPVAALYHSTDLGIHTEHGPTDHHGPPPPSYAAAAAAAAAAYHAHHMSPHAGGHHQHSYAHAHGHHQYQPTAGSEHHSMPPPHHYASVGPPPHYGPPPPPVPGSPPPTYRASNVYATAPTIAATGLHPPPGVGGPSAFCPPNAHIQQQSTSTAAAQMTSQQQQSHPGSQLSSSDTTGE